jgi:hypothetical protein
MFRQHSPDENERHDCRAESSKYEQDHEQRSSPPDNIQTLSSSKAFQKLQEKTKLAANIGQVNVFWSVCDKKHYSKIPEIA